MPIYFISGECGSFLFSVSRRRTLLLLLYILLVYTSCHWHFLVYHMFAEPIQYPSQLPCLLFHFQWSVSDKTTHACPEHTHTQTLHSMLCDSFFSPAKRIYSSQCCENLISSARKIPHFHLQASPCSRVNHHVADRKYKRNIASNRMCLYVCLQMWFRKPKSAIC